MTGWSPIVPLSLLAAAYGVGVRRLRRRGDGWPVQRTLAAASALLCLAAAMLPPLADLDEQFVVHVSQHLLLAAYAPLLLAVSAPVTLALRTLPASPRRVVLSVARSRVIGVLSHPAVLVVLDVGGLYALYLTPLFGQVEDHPLLHEAVHVHMLLTGCLLSWYLVGADPVRHRPTTRDRLLVLVATAGAHDILAKLMYAHDLPTGAGTLAATRAGAQLMFYGGDAAEVALAVVILGSWYARTGRDLARQRRRAAGPLRTSDSALPPFPRRRTAR